MTSRDASTYYRGAWINLRHAGRCSVCRGTLFKGERALYVAARRAVVCARCAEPPAAGYRGHNSTNARQEG